MQIDEAKILKCIDLWEKSERTLTYRQLAQILDLTVSEVIHILTDTKYEEYHVKR